MPHLHDFAAAMTIVTIMTYDLRAESPLKSDLVLKVQPENFEGIATNRFAKDEPVWLSVALANTSAVPMNVFQLGAPYLGVNCRPTQTNAAGVQIVYQNIDIGGIRHHMTLSKGNAVTVRVPLSDFLRVRAAGPLTVDCEVTLYRTNMGLASSEMVLRSVVPLQFTDHLGWFRRWALVRQLRKQFDSSDERTRTDAIKSCSPIPYSSVMELLGKAMLDKTERVQLAAVEVLARLDAPKEKTIPLLQLGTMSEYRVVRGRALRYMDPPMPGLLSDEQLYEKLHEPLPLPPDRVERGEKGDGHQPP
jgi:hypothetical protein